jgi:diadenosine tetraphosphate (Ap4A) HIT family hydrolase
MIDSPPSWSLHPQLEQDTEPVGDLPLSRLLVNNDANYPWLLLVPRRAGASELIDLADGDQAQLMTEIAQTSRALKAVTSCEKLNVAALGNIVPQLHVHVVARRTGDAAWPKPVWGAAPMKAYTPDELGLLVTALRRAIRLA